MVIPFLQWKSYILNNNKKHGHNKVPVVESGQMGFGQKIPNHPKVSNSHSLHSSKTNRNNTPVEDFG